MLYVTLGLFHFTTIVMYSMNVELEMRDSTRDKRLHNAEAFTQWLIYSIVFDLWRRQTGQGQRQQPRLNGICRAAHQTRQLQ